jgi:transcription elongation factor Elf1
MNCSKYDTLLILTCPHCTHERLSAGLHMDSLVDINCSFCGAQCDVRAINKGEAIKWIQTNYCRANIK